mmetsp:Transcript_50182/g.79907  ORF Transcript_50182/g.79907 Transcript_50182/m.79907 type:complete len:665 (-) Transcript_50182:180-2174(-)
MQSETLATVTAEEQLSISPSPTSIDLHENVYQKDHMSSMDADDEEEEEEEEEKQHQLLRVPVHSKSMRSKPRVPLRSKLLSHDHDDSHRTRTTKSGDSPDTYGPRSGLETCFAFLFFVYAITTVASFGLLLVKNETTAAIGNSIYYVGLIFYQICVFIVSYWGYENLQSIPKMKIHRSWNELIFYGKFAVCSVFNLFTAVLIFRGVDANIDGGQPWCKLMWYLIATSYLLNIASIPLPGIILFEYLHTKNSTQLDTKNVPAASASDPLLETQKSRSRSVETSVHWGLKSNVFGKKLMCCGICCAYCVHYLHYILLPAVAPREFREVLSVMYGGEGNWSYLVNHQFLRTFQGMSLNGIFWVFFATLIARHHEKRPEDGNKLSEWQCVKHLLITHHWVYAVMTVLWIACGVLDYYAVHLDRDTKTSINISLSDMMSVWWTLLHLIGILMCARYIYLFSGAIKKYTDRKNSRFADGKTVDNISYAFKAVLLLILFGIQLIALLEEDVSESNVLNSNLLDWIRMMSIWMLTIFELVTLVQLRTMQCNDEYLDWCSKANRARNLRWRYFVFLILLNVIDLSYVYIYALHYYTNQRLEEPKARISYAMSFAGPAIITICVSQLIISNAEFHYAFHRKVNRLALGLSSVSGETALSRNDGGITELSEQSNM